MKSAVALQTFFNKGPCVRDDIDYPKVSVTELKEFKDSIDQTEYHALAQQACKIMGTTWEA